MKMIVTRTSKNNKNITLKIEDGILQVTAPQNIDANKILSYINQNNSWIAQQLKKDTNKGKFTQHEHTHNNKMLQSNTKQNNANINNEENATDRISAIFSGKACLLCGKFIEVKGGSAKKTSLEDHTLTISENAYKDKQLRIKSVKAFIKKVATQILSQEISKFGCSVSLCPSKIEIKALKGSDWLDCSSISEKKIAIDYRTIQLPIRLQRYIIIHAFSHFFESGHTTAFWNIVSNYLPSYRTAITELQNYNFIKDI